MRLTVNDLQKIVDQTLSEEKAAEALRAEIKRVLGPVVVTEGKKIEQVVAEANDRLDVLSETGRMGRLDFSQSVATRFLDHTHPEVRRFAARVVPERFLGKLANDKDSAVRAAVALRVPLPQVKEMMKRFKSDDQLRSIYRTRKKQQLAEAGVKAPETEPMGHDPAEDAERMGDSGKTADVELSEAWYDQQARRFLQDYGRNIEYAWEEIAVHRFVSSLKATSLVEVDPKKLMKCIKDLIEEKEDMALERNSLKETLAFLARQEEAEMLEEGVLPQVIPDADPVREFVEAGLSDEALLERGTKLFRVQEAMLPAGLRKYRLGEGRSNIVRVPAIGYLPNDTGFRAIDEQAMDMFCQAWTRRQAMVGEPLKLEWLGHPENRSKVSFTCILK